MPHTARPHWLLRSRLKLRQLLLVSALGELGNLRRAAAQLNMTQPSASKLLHELESALDVQLFERSRRGMTPTLYGAAMIRHARGLLSDLDAARDEISALAAGASGTLAVGMMTSTVSALVPQAVSMLLERHPAIRVSLVEGTHDLLMPALQNGDLDLVLGRVMGAATLEQVEMEMLYEDEFLVVCGPHHPLRKSRKRELTLTDLVGHQWILPNIQAPLRQRLDILFMEQAGKRPKNAVTSVALLANLALLQESPMLSVMPADLVRQFARSGLLHALPVALPGLYAPVVMISRAGRDHSPATRAFIEELRLVVGRAKETAET